jgi:hypothetical protein
MNQTSGYDVDIYGCGEFDQDMAQEVEAMGKGIF